MSERILIVDDDPRVRRLVSGLLEEQGYATDGAPDVPEARVRLGRGGFSLVLLDVNMPGESGFELLQEISSRQPDLATMMVTGRDEPHLAKAALQLGAYGYLVKPFAPNELWISVANALNQRRLEIENRAHQEHLELTVRERTEALRHAIGDLERSEADVRLAHEETVRRLARAVEFRDEETGLHTERMTLYCGLLARRLGVDSKRCELIRSASALHDVGKIAVPDWILKKPAPLTDLERVTMQRHTDIGFELLAGSKSRLLELAASIAWTHHERFDGGGYPRRIAGDEIPLEGRIAAVADAFDALTSDRPYRDALTLEEALTIMHADRGSQFDPRVLDTFLGAVDEVMAITRSDGTAAFWTPKARRTCAPRKGILAGKDNGRELA